ncbi:bursicon [Anopheles aquasalis]|uniref:bursicon n=1 Tax=Anopheles aquasalis TaxID=42839 RepID=UPI00215B7491|nr:bursicon [Anopheles aquasalis]
MCFPLLGHFLIIRSREHHLVWASAVASSFANAERSPVLLHHGQSSDEDGSGSADDCQVTPVIHVLQYPGCVPKPIPSFACIGRCASYIQVSGSKIWQMERSCMCCQESGEREASVSLFCPKAKNGEKKFRKVRPPIDCLCVVCVSVFYCGRLLPFLC